MTMCVSFCWSDLYALSWWMKQLFSCSLLWKKGEWFYHFPSAFEALNSFELQSVLLLTWWKLIKTCQAWEHNFWWKSIKITSNEVCCLFFCDDLMHLLCKIPETLLKFHRIAFNLASNPPEKLVHLAKLTLSICSNFSHRFTPKCISLRRKNDFDWFQKNLCN